MISIHRFDYNAPSSLLNHSHSGFLSPAPSRGKRVQQKKPRQFLKGSFSINAEGFESLDANMSAKRMRISLSTEEELGSSVEGKIAADDFGEPVNLSQAAGGGASGKLRARKLKNQMPALGLEPDDEEDCTVYFYDTSKTFQA